MHVFGDSCLCKCVCGFSLLVSCPPWAQSSASEPPALWLLQDTSELQAPLTLLSYNKIKTNITSYKHKHAQGKKNALFFWENIPDQMKEELVIKVDTICKANLISALSVIPLNYQEFLCCLQRVEFHWFHWILTQLFAEKNRDGHGAVQIVCLEDQKRKPCAGV